MRPALTPLTRMPSWLWSSAYCFISAMTAAFGMQDGVAHTWRRKGTYWLRDTANDGTP